MKNKQEHAQLLAEALDQVDDSMLRQAMEVDTAEKFHTLDGNMKKVRFAKDRPVATFHRVAAIAACLAVALTITFGGIALAQYLDGFFGADPTGPLPMTQPPGTTQTEPSDPDLPILADITISTGKCSEVLSLYAMEWTEIFDKSSNTWKHSDGDGADGILYRSKWDQELYPPELILNSAAGDTVALELPKNAVLNEIRVYLQNGPSDYTEMEDFPGTIDALLNLKGSWFVVANITWQGRFIEAENRYELHCYEYVFTVDVAAPIVVDGSCGEDAAWEFDPATGTLTISGTGEMRISNRAPWLEYANHITNLVIENGITEICGFRRLQRLTAVQIPISVCALADYVFEECVSLETLTLPNSIKTIGESAFCKCTKLQNIQLPATLSTISAKMFAQCSSLQSIVLPGSISDIYEYAFYSCEQLRQITIPSQVTCIDVGTFQDCHNLQSVTFGYRVDTINTHAFENCFSLTEIHLPDSITNLYSAFTNCYALEKVSIGLGTISIWCDTFSGCNQLKEITIHPDNPNFFSDGSVIYTKNSNIGSAVVLMAPGFTGEYTVLPGTTGICHSAFATCQNLTSVILPYSVNSIEQNAFSYCTQLQSVQLSQNLQFIGEYAFRDCLLLTELTIPAKVRIIQESVFFNCEKLTQIVFLGNAPEIHESTFRSVTATAYYPAADSTWTANKRSNYGGSITWVSDLSNNPRGTCGENATWELDLATGTLTISGSGEMEYLTSGLPWRDYTDTIVKVIIESGVESICQSAFAYCQNLASVQIAEGVHTIGDSAFECCAALKTVVFPASVRHVKADIFRKCTALTYFTFTGPLPEIHQRAFRSITAIAYYPGNDPSWSEGLQNYGGTLHWEPVLCTGEHTPISIEGTAPTCTTEGLTDGERCSVCGYSIVPQTVIPKTNHRFGDWSVSISPTTDHPGELYRTCQDCFCGDVAQIPQLDPSAMAGICGESVHWALNNGTLTISGAGIVLYNPWAHLADRINNVVIENGITAIGCAAFYEHKNLHSVSIADSITYIAGYAFYGCSSLTNVQLSSALTSIERSAFRECAALQQITIPNSVTSIAYDAFRSCKKLNRVTLSNSLTQIQDSAFADCTALIEIVFPATLTELGDCAFVRCTALKKLYFLGAPPYTQNSTFLNVTATAYYPPNHPDWTDSNGGLGSHGGNIIEKPNASIPENKCGDNLTWILTNGVLTISGKGSMYEYSNRNLPPWWDMTSQIHTLVLPIGLTHISSCAFVGLSNITELEIPSTVTSVGSQAFSGCTGLTALTIPNSVETIEHMAFHGCANLKTVTFDTSITLILDNAFMLCGNLSEVRFLGNIPSMVDAFKGLTLTIYYPADNETWTQEAIDKQIQIYGSQLQFVAVDENGDPVNP